MLDFCNWEDELLADSEMYKNKLIDEAKANSKSPQKAVDYLKGLIQPPPDKYNVNTDQLVINLMNKTVEDAIDEIKKEVMNQEWSNLND